MRKHAEWMAQPDDRILELVDEHGPLKEWEIRDRLSEAGEDMEYPAKYLEFRCATLRTHGLLEELMDGRYDITEEGRSYLAGQLDAGSITAAEPTTGNNGDSQEFII